MTWTLSRSTELADGTVRWESLGEGPPIVLVHGTPYSSFLWRDVALALTRRGRLVYVFDPLGYGQSDEHDGQDLTLAYTSVLASPRTISDSVSRATDMCPVTRR